jgi:ATP-dependent Clp protease adaptor protein ClpS
MPRDIGRAIAGSSVLAAGAGTKGFSATRQSQYHVGSGHRLGSIMSDNGNGKRGGGEGPGTGVIVKAKPKTKKPSMYKVLMLNDDYTPMEFVVHILERFFNKNRQEATRIMLHVHKRGVGVCGVYTYEVAETKVTQVMDFARQHQHPLQCTLEKD